MNLIYSGSYKARFKKIIEVITAEAPKSVLELCFGDTFIAEHRLPIYPGLNTEKVDYIIQSIQSFYVSNEK